jgi:hypothetical protein
MCTFAQGLGFFGGTRRARAVVGARTARFGVSLLPNVDNNSVRLSDGSIGECQTFGAFEKK